MDYKKILDQAENFYVLRRYDKALKIFKRLYELEPTNDCLNYIGCTHLELSEYTSAIDCFETLIEKCPDWERPVFNLGRVYLKMGDNDNALKYFNRAAVINPYDEDVYYYLGVYYESVKDNDTALKQYLHSLEINYEQAEAHLNLGVCYMRQNLCREALHEFEATLYYDKTCQNTIYNQGLAYKHMKVYKHAIEKFETLYKLDPQNIEYLMYIETCYSKLGDWENARYWNNKILEIQPDNGMSLQVSQRLDERINK